MLNTKPLRTVASCLSRWVSYVASSLSSCPPPSRPRLRARPFSRCASCRFVLFVDGPSAVRLSHYVIRFWGVRVLRDLCDGRSGSLAGGIRLAERPPSGICQSDTSIFCHRLPASMKHVFRLCLRQPLLIFRGKMCRKTITRTCHTEQPELLNCCGKERVLSSTQVG